MNTWQFVGLMASLAAIGYWLPSINKSLQEILRELRTQRRPLE